MSYKNRTYLVRNNSSSAYFFRLIIPRDLRKNFNNTRELRVSLKTGILSEARRISQQLKFQADSLFKAIRYGNISTTCVTSIKELLKKHRDRLLLQYLQGLNPDSGKNNGIDTQNGLESPPFTPGPPPIFNSGYEDMKLDPDLKLVKSYYNKFKYKDVLEFCEDNSIEPTEDLFPKRFIRRCRQNIVKMLEETDILMETAEEIALEVIEAHLDTLSRKDLAEFFARLGLSGETLEKAESREEILEALEDHVDTVKLALKIGVDILFQEDDEDQLEDTEAEEENEQPEHPEPDFERVCRNWKRLYKPPANKPTQANGTQPPEEPQGPRLSEVSKDYFNEMKTAGAHSPKTMLEKKSAMDRFLEITGDVRVNELSHEIARKYKQTLMKLPANLKKDKRYRDISIEKVIKMKGVKPIAVNTVNNNLAVVIAFMNWSKRQGYVKENYFEGLKLAKNKKAQDDRKAFSGEDIKAIFNPATYRKSVKDRPSRYWVPLLGAFTGARLNELCQLHVEDVIQEDGIWCISINDNSEDEANPKKLKNKASERLIPVHNELITLGFIDFVNRQIQSNHIRLFPELKHGIDGFSRLTSRWFNNTYLRKTLGITDKRKSFHSFRHTVADNLKQQGISESYISELLGHSSGKSETFGRYGKKYRPKVLLTEAVSKIKYEGLEVEELNP